MAISLQGFNPEIANLIQDRVLERVFHDNLFPRLLFRSEAMPEKWAANLGEVAVFTRPGLIPVSTTPLTPGTEPSPSNYQFEQWSAECNQYGNTTDTHMPTSRTALAPLVLRDTQQLGLNAGQTLNRLVRDRLFRAYTGGNTATIALAAIGATTIHVANVNGFTESLFNGSPVTTNVAAPIAVSFGGSEPDNTVIGATPDDPAAPFGPGILTLGAALTAGVAARESVLAANRSFVYRVGGGTNVDAIGSTDILKLEDIIAAVKNLQTNDVPPHRDGKYHCHLSPSAISQIYQDEGWQRLYTALPDSVAYRDLALGEIAQCYHYQNTEAPNASNSGTLATSGAAGAQSSSDVGAEVINNASQEIGRVIITGGGSIYEKYVDEGEFLSEAGSTGKIGQFQVVNGGVQVMTNRIRFIMRAPLDRFQQVIAQSWSFSGDFPIPSDSLIGSAARFKRAVVIEHAA
jgi:hypothetical protein